MALKQTEKVSLKQTFEMLSMYIIVYMDGLGSITIYYILCFAFLFWMVGKSDQQVSPAGDFMGMNPRNDGS